MRVAVALTLSLLTVDPVAQQTVVYETVARTVQVYPEPIPTPILDSHISDAEWEEMERQSECLYVFLRDHFGYDITLERVLAAGAWTDELGGACAMIGEDDE